MVYAEHAPSNISCRSTPKTYHCKGICDIVFRPETGTVTHVTVLQSTGSKLLDNAAVKAFSDGVLVLGRLATHACRLHLLLASEYQVPPRKDHRGVDLISDALPFGRLWYGEPNAIGYAKHYSCSYHAVIRVYDEAGNVIETHEHAGDFKEW